jgi:hypothetical protein
VNLGTICLRISANSPELIASSRDDPALSGLIAELDSIGRHLATTDVRLLQLSVVDRIVLGSAISRSVQAMGLGPGTGSSGGDADLEDCPVIGCGRRRTKKKK